ncbi:MAG: prephenate dehydratase [Cyanobacteria bacterium P01_A01_bin.3]
MSGLGTVGYLGPAGTFTEAAALSFQPDEGLLVPYSSNQATLQAVADGEVEWGVVPVENSVQGAVTTTLDMLWQLDGLHIHQAEILPIRHYLMGFATSLSAIEVVYAHPQALAQCQRWLSQHLPHIETIPAASNTSELARLSVQPTAAAISSKRAASVYNLPLLANAINDYDSNSTQFWVVSRTPSPGGPYTSFAFSVQANIPGALLQPLMVLAAANINMRRIESRPTKLEIGDYVFFIDAEHQERDSFPESVSHLLGEITATIKVFGSYPLKICSD